MRHKDMNSHLPLVGSAFALASLVLACAAEPADTGLPVGESGGTGNNTGFGGTFGSSGSSAGGDGGVGGGFGTGGASGYGGTNGSSGSDGSGGALGSSGSSGSSGAFGSDGSGGSSGSGSGGTGVDGGTDAGCIPFPFPCPTGGTSGVGGTAGAPGDAGDSLPGFTPMPNNPKECPQGAPANPIGLCLGLPIYLACNYTNGTRNYGCVCDWYHWLCI